MPNVFDLKIYFYSQKFLLKFFYLRIILGVITSKNEDQYFCNLD